MINKYKTTKGDLFLSIALLIFSLFATSSNLKSEEFNASLFRVCGWFGCEQAYSNQSGGNVCGDSFGVCYLYGGCCNKCPQHQD